MVLSKIKSVYRVLRSPMHAFTDPLENATTYGELEKRIDYAYETFKKFGFELNFCKLRDKVIKLSYRDPEHTGKKEILSYAEKICRRTDDCTGLLKIADTYFKNAMNSNNVSTVLDNFREQLRIYSHCCVHYSQSSYDVRKGRMKIAKECKSFAVRCKDSCDAVHFLRLAVKIYKMLRQSSEISGLAEYAAFDLAKKSQFKDNPFYLMVFAKNHMLPDGIMCFNLAWHADNLIYDLHEPNAKADMLAIMYSIFKSRSSHGTAGRERVAHRALEILPLLGAPVYKGSAVMVSRIFDKTAQMMLKYGERLSGNCSIPDPADFADEMARKAVQKYVAKYGKPCPKRSSVDKAIKDLEKRLKRKKKKRFFD